MVTKNTKTSDERTMMIITHILGLFLGFIGPLIILLVAKDTETKNHARKALNWQITMAIIGIILFGVFFTIGMGSMLLTMVNPLFMIVYFVCFFLLWIPIMGLGIANLVFCIMAAIKAKDGILWTYPFSIPLLKTE